MIENIYFIFILIKTYTLMQIYKKKLNSLYFEKIIF
jgi:hypothetical protein